MAPILDHHLTYERRVDPETGERYRLVYLEGATLLRDPLLNKGTAFTAEERASFGVRGLLPAHICSIEEQLVRVGEAYATKDTNLGRNIYLASLQDRNETLFYRFVSEHLQEMTPIIYTPVVAEACRHWSHIFRRPRGIYLTPGDRGRMVEVLQHSPVDAGVIVVTDNERILGIGDQGAGGMGIPIGKLALYTLGAGIHPARCLPVSLDVGTDNEDLLRDPVYLGWREPRLRGDPYWEFVDEFVKAVCKVFPGVLLQWEDFGNNTSFRNLETYRDVLPSFNDDIQGTAAVAVSGLMGAMRMLERRLEDQTIVMLGAGSAGVGIARQIAAAMQEQGASAAAARSRIYTLDSKGLVIRGREGLNEHKLEFAVEPERIASWDKADRVPFLDVVRQAKPTVLFGVSGQPGVFTEEIVRAMAKHTDRPMIFPLSNPTANCEARPEDLVRWTEGRAIVATGSPFDDVFYDGRRYRIGQGNNVFVFPGVGLGTVVSQARRVTDGMFLAAAQALAGVVDDELLNIGSVYPRIDQMRQASRAVARAVAERAVADGVAEPLAEDLDALLDRSMWVADYVPYRRA
ncbi:MAG: NAD-dependent malic enzyme [Planctomycetota bacterium]|nr:NAD-dependent malic enzyme [Planctomycetota bacterium]